MRQRLVAAVATLSMFLWLTPTGAFAGDKTVEKQGAPTTPYYQGRTRFGLGGGLSGRSGGDTTFSLAASFGVFVIDNLEVGVDTQMWFGADPFVAQLGPGIRYILPVSQAVHPYLGAFYRHWFVGDDLPDQDALGVRAGVLIRSQSVYFQLGIVYEGVISECDIDCDDFYPEFGISILL